MKIKHPYTGKEISIQAALRDLASQEGCDGEPYDQMQLAAECIDRYESCITKIVQKCEEDIAIRHIDPNSETSHYTESIIKHLKDIIK